jgi:Zn finger protein HypA/HybF involved in hydrogenase expression
MAQNQKPAGNQKISNYIMMIVLIVLALSVVSILLAVSVYLSGVSTPSHVVSSSQTGQDDLTAAFLAIIGLVAMTMSMFTLSQSRRQAAEMKIEIPKVMTTIECKKCGTKTMREFQRGDYVYKDLDACPKCPDTKQVITAVYKEIKEKEKTYNV